MKRCFAAVLALLIAACIQAAAPNAPSNLTASAVSGIQINLAWWDNSDNETSFIVERSTDGISFGTSLTLGPNFTSVGWANHSERTQYYFRVCAKNDDGISYSNVVTATTLLSEPYPLTAQGTSTTRVALSWADRSSFELGFRIEASEAGGPFVEIGTTSTNATTYNAVGLTPDTSYRFRVRAYDLIGNSRYNPDVQTAYTFPNAPTGLNIAAQNGSSLQLSWTDNSNTEMVFEIQRVVVSTFQLIATVAPNITTYLNTELSGTPLTEDTEFIYRVRARNPDGVSSWSNQATGKTLLNRPTGLTATAASSTRINLGWTDNSSAETSYVIERSTTSGTGYAQIGTVAANATSYSDTTGSPATTYHYRVRAFSASNASLFSSEASDTTLSLDYGDAPDPNYPTLAANNGASHDISNGLCLGAVVDGDVDGQPNATASGDNDDGLLTTSIARGVTGYIRVVASQAGRLDAWIDLNQDGDWNDAGEQVCTNYSLDAGTNDVPCPVAAGAALGTTIARFRISTGGSLATTGNAADGEVEDHQVTIVEPAPTDIALSNSFIAEGKAIGTTFGMLTSTDPSPSDTHTYTFAAGTGDDDNASFTIDGDQLKTAIVGDRATKVDYSIRIQSEDSEGFTYQKQFTITVIGDIIYVKADGNDADDGTAWSDALQSLQIAIDRAAGAGSSEVWVEAGTYSPGSNRSSYFRMANNVAVYGGFAGVEAARAQRDYQANSTILSGNIGTPANTDNCYSVILNQAGLDATAILDGVTISGGNANEMGHDKGGGILTASSETYRNCVISNNYGGWGGAVAVSYSSPSFVNCTISNNSAQTKAGGVYIEGGAPSFTDCDISGNEAHFNVASPFPEPATGGGVCTLNSTASFLRCMIRSNSAQAYGHAANQALGGGVFCQSSSASVLTTFTECTIANNQLSSQSTTTHGGGVYGSALLRDCTITDNRALNGGGVAYPEVVGCTITGNVAGSHGGGVHGSNLVRNCTVTGNRAAYGGGLAGITHLVNCTVTDNTATVDGGGLHTSGTIVAVNSIIWGNGTESSGTIKARYSTIKGLTVLTNGNSNEDPQLQVLGSHGGPTQTCALTAGSPAIDAGRVVVYQDSDAARTLFYSDPSFSGYRYLQLDLAYTPTSTDSCLTTVDQRGVARPQGANGDMGAYERGSDYTVTFVAGTGGSLSGAASQTVEYLQSSSAVTALPSTGYYFVNWTVGASEHATTATTSAENVSANITLTANFAIYTYDILATAGANGSVNPAGTTTVNYGSNQAYTITADPGHQISDVLVDGTSIGAVSAYTFINVRNPHTISASFIKTSCVVTAIAGANGRVAMDGAIGTTLTQTVTGGSTTTPIFAQADTGYRFVQWNDGNTDNPRTLTVTDDITITAAFTAYNQPPVAVAAATPETLATTGGQVDLSASGSYDPDNGPNPLTYSWTVVSAPAATTITDDDQTDASFTPSAEGTYVIRLTVSDGADSDSADVQVIVGNLHVVTVNAGTGGKVQLAGGEAGPSVQEGVTNGATSSTFTAVADTGYTFANWSDGSPEGASRSFTNVTADTTVTATFTKTLHTVTFVLSSANGELIGSTTQNVANGADCSPVMVIPNTGYELVRWEYGGGSTSTDNPITITSVGSDLTVTAMLTVKTYDIVATASAGGSISPLGTTSVDHGTDQTFTITPDTDYVIGTLIVDGVTVGAPNSYTFTNIQADHSIEVVFFSSTGSGGRVVTVIKKDDGGCNLGASTISLLPLILVLLGLITTRFRYSTRNQGTE